VAFGAAVQAAILKGVVNETTDKLVMVDVSPLSLGIETNGEVMTKIIERNTQLPCSKSQVFSTAQDNQPAVTIQVYEGERARTKDNNRLGKFDLTGIPPAPRGVPQIEVKFDLDTNCILKVEACDRATKNAKSITITNDTGRLSADQINKMLADAEKWKDEDQKASQRATAKNHLDSYAYNLRKTLNDSKASSKMSSEDRTALESAVAATMKWMDTAADKASTAEIEAKQKELEQVGNPIMTRLYSGGSGAAPDAADDASSASASASAPPKSTSTVQDVD